MNILKKICLVLVAVMLPISIICLSDTAVWRVSDTYQYNLNDTQILDEQGVNVTVSQVSHTFSNFMNGKTEEFQLVESTGSNREELFSEEADQAMTNLKLLLDILLIVGISCLAISVMAYIFLIYKGHKTTVRKWFKGALIIFAVLFVGNILFQIIPALREAAYGWIYDYSFAKGDLLVEIMKESMVTQFAIFESIVAAIIMCIVWYISSNITKPETIFIRRRRY